MALITDSDHQILVTCDWRVSRLAGAPKSQSTFGKSEWGATPTSSAIAG
jgi:hypothetical protein